MPKVKITNRTSASLEVGAPFGVTLAPAGQAGASVTRGLLMKHMLEHEETLMALGQSGKVSLEMLPDDEGFGLGDKQARAGGMGMMAFMPDGGGVAFSVQDGVFGPLPAYVCKRRSVTLVKLRLWMGAAVVANGTNYVTLAVKKKDVDGSDVATLATRATSAQGLPAGRSELAFQGTVVLTEGQAVTVEGAKAGTGATLVGALHVEVVMSPDQVKAEF